ncbi:tRNA (guanine-N(7)-)-methyltransferase (chromatophore) [Paulinella micropora]|uniref:tRNA (guanine(46)-N(7))-methyltransferase n=1 Tax=Paulinella micropora TaxID=1928728 RepID=A0A1L5YC78_9EUKA|nr:tRNA (guanine-N(7)-)-methyltransferase [Paulinella micropora]AQX45069.1 tRNA (guanine-N(7)-)-methyltransferase [Paulinella micropora]BBL86280.1 tRNA (guanine-N(7)-)-methyltransferase [Paulinella micropora]
MRQHVNPLSRFFQIPVEFPPITTLFKDTSLPIHLDIGCARGRFLLKVAQMEPTWNYLGIEIREPLVTTAESDRKALGLSNLYYVFCNANVSLKIWLESLQPGQIKRVSIQFPDPWFKKKHLKRRILKPSLLLVIAKGLTEGNHLFFQSDVKEVIDEMIAITELTGYFDRCRDEKTICNGTNPLLVPTEREHYVISKGLPVYRVSFKRNNVPLLLA